MRNSVLYGIIIIGAFLSLVVINAEFPSFAEAVVTTFQFKTLTCSGCTLTNGTTTITLTTQTGTYNKTLANNVVVNSNGNRINFINSTGNPIHLVNDPTRNQVNVTITQPSVSTRTIDLSSANVYTKTIDNDTADTAITATAEPASPQFVQTISVGNIPTDVTDVQDYTVILTVGGKNTNATTAKTISVIATRNGVDIDTTRSVAVTNGNFWESGNYLSSVALSAGDKIGLKMWCSSSPCSSGGGLDYRYATLYIVPRLFISTTNSEYSIMPTGTLTVISGSVTGVTYAPTTPVGGLNTIPAVIDTISGTSNPPSSSLSPVLVTTIKGQNISELGVTASNSSPLRASTDTGSTPAQQAASDLMSLSIPRYVRITTLS